MKLQLNKHDRICFFGDSITAEGMWISEITQYFMQNHPDLEIGIYNCGISGSRASEAMLKNRIYCDCLHLHPKYVVVMFGMNDVERDCHGSSKPEDALTIKKAISLYPKTLRNIVDVCKASGAIPIICSPTPYNEYADLPEANFLGTDKDLQTFAQIAQSIALEYGLIYVDMRSAIFDKLQNNPIREDRVHPNNYGYHLMAERFLYTIGAKSVEETEVKCVISEKNKLRYEAEQKLRHLMFVEHNCMLWQYENVQRTVELRKKLVGEFVAKCEGEFWKEIEKNYMENIDHIDELRGEIVKLTTELYQ